MKRAQKLFRIESYGTRGAPEIAEGPSGQGAGSEEILQEIRSLRRLIEPEETLSARQLETFKSEIAEARKMRAELDSIQLAIEQTKHEIASVHTSGFQGAQMARVTGELDAIVQGTFDATDQILSAAETIDRETRSLEAALASAHDKDVAADVLEQVVKIFEACNFQDLTGQRITKVVNTLKFIEDRIVKMIDIWGGIETFDGIEVEDIPVAGGDASLLNGPKLSSDAGHASQDDIDALFN